MQVANTLRGIVVQQLVPALDGGLALATEVLLPTTGSSSASAPATPPTWPRRSSAAATSGMGTMDQSLADLVHDGIVDVDVAAERAVDPNELRYLLSGDTR